MKSLTITFAFYLTTFVYFAFLVITFPHTLVATLPYEWWKIELAQYVSFAYNKGATGGYTMKQFFMTNSTTGPCSGFFNNATNTCSFTVSLPQTPGSFVVVWFTAQRAGGISVAQGIAATDNLGNSYFHPASCQHNPAPSGAVFDCVILTNANGGGTPTVAITLSGLTAQTERISVGYSEGSPNAGAGLGVMDGTAADVTLGASCGAPGNPCIGPGPSDFTLTGTNEFCTMWVVGAQGQASIAPSPWTLNYGTNGDHSAGTAAVGLTNAFPPPQWTTASANGGTLGGGVCAM